MQHTSSSGSAESLSGYTIKPSSTSLRNTIHQALSLTTLRGQRECFNKRYIQQVPCQAAPKAYLHSGYWQSAVIVFELSMIVADMVSTPSLFSLFQPKARMASMMSAGELRLCVFEPRGSTAKFLDRIMESMARAFNNLTERLHASFLLYLLPEPFQFLSVATYLSAPILIGAALTIAGLRLWRHCPSRAKMSVWQPISFAYAVGSSLLYFDQHGVSTQFKWVRSIY